MSWQSEITMKTFVIVILVLGFSLLALLFAGPEDSSVCVLKLAHVLDASHPVSQGMVRLAEELETVSNGKMRLDIYPSGQLGASEREYIESLQIGSLDMAKVSSAVLENFVPQFAVLSLPYIFTSDQHRWNVLFGPEGQRLLTLGEPVWLRGLCFYESGSRNFYLRDKAVHTPDDLKGLKIRVMKSYWAIQTINALGGSATPISFGELYTALQQGVVDGAENNISTLYRSRHYEASKYFVLDGHSSPSDVLMISTHRWNRLSQQQQSWLMHAVGVSLSYQRNLWDQAEQKALEDMRQKGLTVIEPDKSLFREKVQSVYDIVEKEHLELYQLMVDIQAIPDDKDYLNRVSQSRLEN